MFDSSRSSRLAQWRCRTVGCDWERRKAYDYCRYCRSARWHIAATSTTPPSEDASGTLALMDPRALMDRSRWAAGAWVRAVRGLLDCEGSELFVDPTDLAEAA